MNLGNTIKSIRLQRGFKQNQFADICNITQAYLSQIENNLKEPTLATLKEISIGLDTPLPILFFLSLDDDDVKSEKQEAFKLLSPSIKSLINQFFVSTNG